MSKFKLETAEKNLLTIMVCPAIGIEPTHLQFPNTELGRHLVRASVILGCQCLQMCNLIDKADKAQSHGLKRGLYLKN